MNGSRRGAWQEVLSAARRGGEMGGSDGSDWWTADWKSACRWFDWLESAWADSRPSGRLTSLACPDSLRESVRPWPPPWTPWFSCRFSDGGPSIGCHPGTPSDS